jgi:hypothetical protein
LVKSIVVAAGMLILALSIGMADTITAKDSRSWNGHAQTQNGVLTLQANFPGGSRTLPFSATYLRAIEFNPTIFNPGAFPNLPAAAAGNPSGTVYMRDRSKKPVACDGIVVTNETIACRGGNWKRDDVIRIIFK